MTLSTRDPSLSSPQTSTHTNPECPNSSLLPSYLNMLLPFSPFRFPKSGTPHPPHTHHLLPSDIFLHPSVPYRTTPIPRNFHLSRITNDTPSPSLVLSPGLCTFLPHAQPHPPHTFHFSWTSILHSLFTLLILLTFLLLIFLILFDSRYIWQNK